MDSLFYYKVKRVRGPDWLNNHRRHLRATELLAQIILLTITISYSSVGLMIDCDTNTHETCYKLYSGLFLFFFFIGNIGTVYSLPISTLPYTDLYSHWIIIVKIVGVRFKYFGTNNAKKIKKFALEFRKIASE